MIYDAVISLVNDNTAVDFATLSERLQSTGKLDGVGGLSYLNTISDAVPSAANFKHYIEVLKKYHLLRRLLLAGNEIVKESLAASDEQAALKKAEKLIFDISKEDERKELTLLADEMPKVMDLIDRATKDPASLRGITTGYYALDDITNGLQKGDLIILGARPSVGKTSLGLNIILNAAINGKKKCAVFSLEMSKMGLALRAACSVAKVSSYKAMRGDLDADELTKLVRANKKVAGAEIYLDEMSALTSTEIMRKCMRLKREQGLDLVMVDYLGLMGTTNTSKNVTPQIVVSENSRAMKVMAKELDIPVLLLAQLNRGIEARRGQDSEPVLSDLRDSGAIEQDADIVMFIHKPKEEQTEILPEDGQKFSRDYRAKVIIAKHRNGPTGTFDLQFKGEWTSFLNPTHNEGGHKENLAEVPMFPKKTSADVPDVF
jgi:replicative DNA helicase